jgi:ClpX C4-type zinc finger
MRSRHPPDADPAASAAPHVAVGLPQHPDQHRPESPILLAVDQQLGEGSHVGRIDTVESRVRIERSWSRSSDLICWFCGKPQGAVKHLIAGPRSPMGQPFTCNECVALCAELIAEEDDASNRN